MDESTNLRTVFTESLDRCMRDEGFIPAFYGRFLSVSDEIRLKFRDTNFDRQNAMLLRSLRLVAGAAAGDRDALREIRDRAETHSRDSLDINPRLYDFWLEAVIETAAEYDSDWNESVETAWRTILGYVIAQMIKYY